MPDAADPIDPRLFDPAVSPAEDFYRHANGGWLDTNPVPPEYPQWGALQQLTERNQQRLHRIVEDAAREAAPAGSPARMVGDYFAAGMDEPGIAAAGIEPLRPLLDRIDGVTTAAAAFALGGELLRVAGEPFHGLSVSADFEDADAYLLYLGEGGLGLPDRDYYLVDDERSADLRAAYLAHVGAQLRHLGQDEDRAAAGASAILAFETRLASASLTNVQRRDPRVFLNRVAAGALDELMPVHGLAAHVRALGGTGTSVNVDNPAFFRELDAALAETPVETLRQYLRWHLVRALASALSPAFEDEAFAFYGTTLGGQQVKRHRWRRILEAASLDIGEQVAQLYVAEAFTPASKARVETLVGHLQAAMGTAIRTNTWMTEPTRGEALAKLATFRAKIGYPDRWRSFAGLAIGRASHAANRMAASAFEYDRQLGRLGHPVDRDEWEMAAHIVNAYYHPLLNEIVFPAGVLQPPFFYPDADDAVNYGAIGVVIGHEITHGFDDAGRQFDARGARRDWWTAEDAAEFERRAQVLVEQASGFEIADGVRLNGELTLGENIADLGGLRIAWDALHEVLPPDAPAIDGLTAAQRFFLAFAVMWRSTITDAYARLLAQVDVHAPAKFRVNGPVANFPPFAATFAIPDGAPMARPAATRVDIW